MKSAPEPNRPQLLAFLKRFMRKVVHQLVGREIHVVEGHNPRHWMLGDLRAPAGLATRVEALPKLETQDLPHGNESAEVLPRTAVSVMVVVGPAKPQAILPLLLHLGRPVSPLPELALGRKEQIAGQRLAEISHSGVYALLRGCEQRL